MEFLQDAVQLAFAIVSIVASVALTEWLTTRGGSMRGGRGALVGVILSLACIFLISELAGWVSAAELAVPHVTGYGRAFSYAVLGLILYVPIRIYQLLRQQRSEIGGTDDDTHQ